MNAKYTNKGLEDVANGYLISSACTESPEKQLKIDLSNIIIMLGTWKNLSSDTITIGDCQKRMIIAPIESINYSMSEIGIINKTNKLCERKCERIINSKSLHISLNHWDLGFVLSILQHQLDHMCMSFFQKIRKYYQKHLEEYQYLQDKELKFNYNKLKNPNLNELLKETLNIIKFFIEAISQYKSKKQSPQIIHDVEKKEEPPKVSSKCKYNIITSNAETFKSSVFDNIKIMLIGCFKEAFCPIFYISFYNPAFSYSCIPSKDSQIEFNTKLELNYYNNEATAWEPLIEPFSIIYRKINNEIIDAMTLDLKNKLNFNISHNLISLIWNCSALCDSNTLIAKKEKEIFLGNSAEFGYINEFAFENLSGEALKVTFKDLESPQEVKINKGEIISLCRNPFEELKGEINLKRRTFRIRIDFVGETIIPPIENVNLAIATEFIHKISNDPNESKKSYICSVKVNNMRKIFTIHTSAQLINELNKRIKVTFINPTTAAEHIFDLCEKEILSVPLEYFNIPAHVTIEDAKVRGRSKLVFNQLPDIFIKNKAVQINIGDNYMGVLILVSSADGKCLNYRLLSPYCICNYLPFDLNVSFINSNNNFVLKPKTSSYIITQTTIGPCPIEISIPGFSKAKFTFEDSQKVI